MGVRIVSFEQVTCDVNWAREEFASVELGDARLNRRCQDVGAQFGEQPGAPIPQACGGWAEAKGAYRLLDHEKVTPAALLAPHQHCTVERMKEHPVVLAVQDTTFLNYTDHPRTEGLGEIGKKVQQQRGLGMHSTLAVTPEGLPLGLLTQAFFVRPIGAPPRTSAELKKLPIEEKESYRWLEALEQTAALAPEGVEVLTVCDREADIYEMFALAQEQQAPLLVRSAHDRSLAEPEIDKLRAKLEQQAVVGTRTVHIVGNQQRKERDAAVTLRFAQVRLKPSWRPHGVKLPVVILHAVLVREEQPPADVEDPIEWYLLINRPVTSFEDADQVVDWYCCRWHIELFHKVLKSGCRVEACRLRTVDRLQKFITLKSVIAWRIHWLTYLNRTDPDAACTVVLTDTEWQALYTHVHRTASLPDAPPTVHQAVRWIAQLGGFLGRRGDGEPGLTVIWRGWQRLQDMADMWSVVNVHSQTCG